MHVYDAALHKYLGGVHQAGSITYANFDVMLRSILLVLVGRFSIRRKDNGNVVTPSDQLVAPGEYVVVSKEKVLLVK